MRVCIGQINTTPGAFSDNLARIVNGIDAALHDEADIVVFPELTIPGYLSQDLIYHPGYIERNLECLQTIVKVSADRGGRLAIVVGYLERSSESTGKPFMNCAAVIRHGRVELVYRKQLLPFYDVFDELRYFEPGDELAIFEVQGEKVGVAICEDLWNDKGEEGYSYTSNPLARYREAGVRTIVSLNSSPFVKNKLWSRIHTIGARTGREMIIVYANQVGGQDELVFDGQSFILRDGDLIHLGDELFTDSFKTIDLASQPVLRRRVADLDNRTWLLSKAVHLRDLLVLGLRDYAVKSGFGELVLASSGGVDSAAVCMLAVDAVGPGQVHALRMPSIFSSDHSRDDALALHRNLGCWDYLVPIEHAAVVSNLNDRFAVHSDQRDNLVARTLRAGRYNTVADENMQARLRDLYVMHFSNAFGAMPLSTGNKTESACGYYTHFDMNFSFAPIKDLYKFEVNALARDEPKIPANIWRKAPSAELAPGQVDEKSLLPYAVLDPIVMSHVEDYVSDFDEFVSWVGHRLDAADEYDPFSANPGQLDEWLRLDSAANDYRRIIRLIGRMEFKRRQTCPGTKVSKVAFGIGRRIPIVEKWS